MTILSPWPPVVRPRFTPAYASWQDAMKDAVRDPVELCRLLELPPETADRLRKSARQFPVFVPRGFLARMKRGDTCDPLLRQVLPLAEELDDVPGFVSDPVGDYASVHQPGLLQKYEGRVLMITTGTCAVHCRYCFRRHFSYSQTPRSLTDWRPALDEIAADESVHEVILSGGDPLTMVDSALAKLIDELALMGHLRRLRIHTRLPVMIPERVTDGLLEMLCCSRLATIVVVHANHTNELDAHVAAALTKLADAGVVMLNQAVLLAGVNDSVAAQMELCERLVDLRVMPYYLHQLDRVAGAAHFEVPVEVGRHIVEVLRTRLPGYAVPRYVQEVARMPNKQVLS